MKIAICSDLHLEFQDIELINSDSAEVLILAGDIMIAEYLHNHPGDTITSSHNLGSRQLAAKRFRDFLTRCSNEFPHVIYIAGNHEFYHGRWKASIQHLRDECDKFNNVYFLEQDVKKINDVTFIGATLWTDCNKNDPITLHALTDMMNDFRIIRDDELGFTKLRPAQIVRRHKETLQYFKIVLSSLQEEKVVVVGHHSPSHQSIHEMYRHDMVMNGGYHSELSEFILDHPQVKLWVHGHTHMPFDYMIGDTRIFCNPRGYSGHDPYSDFFELKFVKV